MNCELKIHLDLMGVHFRRYKFLFRCVSHLRGIKGGVFIQWLYYIFPPRWDYKVNRSREKSLFIDILFRTL